MQENPDPLPIQLSQARVTDAVAKHTADRQAQLPISWMTRQVGTSGHSSGHPSNQGGGAVQRCGGSLFSHDLIDA